MSVTEQKTYVYSMDEYSWFASHWDVERTAKYFESETGEEIDVKTIKICDLEKEGMWLPTENVEDLKRLGDCDSIGSEFGTEIGDLMKRYDEVYKFTSFKEALELEQYGEFDEPFEISSSEW